MTVPEWLTAEGKGAEEYFWRLLWPVYWWNFQIWYLTEEWVQGLRPGDQVPCYLQAEVYYYIAWLQLEQNRLAPKMEQVVQQLVAQNHPQVIPSVAWERDEILCARPVFASDLRARVGDEPMGGKPPSPSGRIPALAHP